MPDRSRSGGLALVMALAGLTACQVSPASLSTAARPPAPMSAATALPQSPLQRLSQPLTLTSDAESSVVDARDGSQVAAGVRAVIESKVGGLEVLQDSAGARLRITGSATSGRIPLFVVDGVPVADGFDVTLLARAIERIDVMQERSAIAPYGPKAVNGVVLIAMVRSH